MGPGFGLCLKVFQVSDSLSPGASAGVHGGRGTDTTHVDTDLPRVASRLGEELS